MTREFVLVHGMSHGAWAWELLTPYLEQRGHRVVTVELPLVASPEPAPRTIVETPA